MTLCRRYKPDSYGHVVSIVRTLSRSGAGHYKLKNGETGHVVMDKGQIRRELEAILQHFEIDIENPLTMLSQDESKTFLFKSTPNTLYEFFSRSTQLENSKRRYCEAKRELDAAEVALGDKRGNLKGLEKDVAEAKKVVEKLRNIKSNGKVLKEKRAEFAWGLVQEAEGALDQAEKAVKVMEAKIQKCKGFAEAKTADLDDIR